MKGEGYREKNKEKLEKIAISVSSRVTKAMAMIILGS
jgi:predicted RNA-binding protein Jag